jgi:hypothetical protein
MVNDLLWPMGAKMNFDRERRSKILGWRVVFAAWVVGAAVWGTSLSGLYLYG